MESGAVEGRKPIGFKPIALDGGYGWFVVLGSFLIHMFADGFVYSFGIIAELVFKEFNATTDEVNLALFWLTGLMLATGPLASAMCNCIGFRITAIIGAFIVSIGCAISYKANSMEFLIFSVGIVVGTGLGLMYFSAIVIVTMYFERLRAIATGVTSCGAGVGTFVFSRVITFLVNSWDWQTLFIIYAGLALLCVPCGMLYRPIEFEPIYDDEGTCVSKQKEMKKIKKNDKVYLHRPLELHLDERSEPTAEEDEDKVSPHRTDDKNFPRTMNKMIDLSLFTNPEYVLFAISTFLTTIGYNVPILMPLRAEKLGFSKVDPAETVHAYGLANTIGLIVCGFVCDRAFLFKYGKDRARNRLWFYSWSLIIVGVATAFVFVMVDQFTNYCFIFGIFISSYVCLTSVILVDLVGVDRLTNALGLLFFVQWVAVWISPRLLKKLYYITHDYYYNLTFVFCGVCLILSGIVLFIIPFMKKSRKEVRLENPAENNGKRSLLLNLFIYESFLAVANLLIFLILCIFTYLSIHLLNRFVLL